MANNAIKAIMQRAFFLGPLAEKIVYNDTEIPAIVEIGEEFNRSEVYFKELDRAVKVSDKANFTVSDADVPNPKPGDSIIYNGQRWNVNAVYLKDSLAGNTTLSASKAERSGLR